MPRKYLAVILVVVGLLFVTNTLWFAHYLHRGLDHGVTLMYCEMEVGRLQSDREILDKLVVHLGRSTDRPTLERDAARLFPDRLIWTKAELPEILFIGSVGLRFDSGRLA